LRASSSARPRAALARLRFRALQVHVVPVFFLFLSLPEHYAGVTLFLAKFRLLFVVFLREIRRREAHCAGPPGGFKLAHAILSSGPPWRCAFSDLILA